MVFDYIEEDKLSFNHFKRTIKNVNLYEFFPCLRGILLNQAIGLSNLRMLKTLIEAPKSRTEKSGKPINVFYFFIQL
ncbi:MAG: hypothetical protein Kapaf2KO_20980 [Candidatus Kapaibacteriales bacterium]